MGGRGRPAPLDCTSGAAASAAHFVDDQRRRTWGTILPEHRVGVVDPEHLRRGRNGRPASLEMPLGLT